MNLNKAYFTTDKDGFEKTYNNNAKSFDRLLKYVFSLPSISLESSKKLLKIDLKYQIKYLMYVMNYLILSKKSMLH